MKSQTWFRFLVSVFSLFLSVGASARAETHSVPGGIVRAARGTSEDEASDKFKLLIKSTNDLILVVKRDGYDKATSSISRVLIETAKLLGGENSNYELVATDGPENKQLFTDLGESGHVIAVKDRRDNSITLILPQEEKTLRFYPQQNFYFAVWKEDDGKMHTVIVATKHVVTPTDRPGYDLYVDFARAAISNRIVNTPLSTVKDGKTYTFPRPQVSDEQTVTLKEPRGTRVFPLNFSYTSPRR